MLNAAGPFFLLLFRNAVMSDDVSSIFQFQTKEKRLRISSEAFSVQVGDYLFSRAVSSELSSAQVSLTSVFGMGTGGTSPSSTPAIHMALPHASLFLEGIYLQN